jgi:hypothetical protein
MGCAFIALPLYTRARKRSTFNIRYIPSIALFLTHPSKNGKEEGSFTYVQVDSPLLSGIHEVTVK